MRDDDESTAIRVERGLAGYVGTVILVTHDRRFLEAFAPDRTIEL